MPEKPEKAETPRDAASAPAKPKKSDRAAEALAKREAAIDRAALQFKALGDPTRLRIVRLLAADTMPSAAKNGTDTAAQISSTAQDGWTVGDVSARLFGKSKISSTLSHHLKELRNAQIITMKRRGKNLICRVQEREIAGLRCYLAISPQARAQTPTEAKETLWEGESRIDDFGDRNDAPAV